MRLSRLIASNEGLTLKGQDVDITGLTNDSRKVEPGFLFIAIPGTKEDGRQFIDDAITRGAVAVLAPLGTTLNQASLVTSAHIRIASSAIASSFYPQQPEIIAAVTGTSGKTSTAQFMREMWTALGHKSASIGTIGYVTEKETRYGSLTTPDAVTLHQLLNESAASGISHLAMEASSHGLILNRLDHVKIKVGGFTNFSRDHLDYHETMESYLAAKLRLFTELLPSGATVVLNADILEYERLATITQKRGLKVISYGTKAREIKLIETKATKKGQELSLELFGKKRDILLPVIGNFQAWNGMCALGMVIAGGDTEDKALTALGKVTGVTGRLQLAGTTQKGASVFVDYAHKPDALENVLKALRPHVAAHQGKLGLVFGCGGNRDKGKRPIMGEIAQRLADWVIVTDDNPRHEDPATIRKDILAGCKPSPQLQEIGDRAKAIERGIEHLDRNDVLIIAGKGHENGQIIGNQTLPFDDVDVARKVLGL